MKQINVKLLAILFLSTLFTLIGAFFLYQFQKNRNANGLLTRAEERSEEGDYEDAVKFYYRYLQLRPEDNEQYAKLALAMKSRIGQLREIGELNAKSFGQAFTLVEQAVRKNPENADLRNTAIEFSMQFGRYTDAIQHIKFLTNDDDPDPELQVKLASCLTGSGQDEAAIPVLCKLIGFDRIDRRFDTTKAIAPKHEDAYQLLASIMHLRARDPESGALVVNELVKMNPESATAYLKRAMYFSRMQNDKFEESISRDLSRALDLAPTDMQIILTAAEFAIKAREFDQAKALYDRCLEHHPDSVFAYRGLATWALNTGDRDMAVGFLQKALEISPENPVILWARANIELEKRDFEALGKTRQELQDLGHPRPFLEFLDGRTHVVKSEWFEASKMLEKSKPQIAQVRPEWLPGLNGALSLCYENMGQHDKRLKACQEMVDASPGNLQARWGVIQSLLAMGQMQKAAEEYGLVERQMKLEQIKMNPALLPAQLQMELLQQDRKPESQRSFQDADKLVQEINKAGMLKDPQVAPVIGAYFVAKGQPEKKARLDKIVQSESASDTSVIAEKIRQIANKDGVEPALAQLSKATSSETVVPLTLRMMRAELLARVRPDEARQDLKALEADLGSFGEDKRVQITRGLGRIYLLMNDIAEMRRLWKKLADDRPQDVRVRLSMFELAMQAGDEDGMKDVINGLEQLVGRNSAEWKWAEAVRMTWKVRNREAPTSDLDDAQALATEAIGQRDGWDALYRLLGEIHVMKSDAPAAIDALEKSLKLSIGHPNVYRSLARLYYAQSDFKKVEKMLEQLPKTMWSNMEDRINLDILARKNALPDEIPYDKDSKRAEDHVWVAKLLTNAGRLREAEVAFKKGLEITPGHADAWTSLVKMYVAANRIDEAKAAIRKAELELSQKESPIFLGQAYGFLGDYKNSILNYERALESDPENKPLLRAIAKSHMDNKNFNKANLFIERLLKDAKANSPNEAREVKWGRRSKAQLLARAGSFHEFAEAIRKIKENADVGKPLASEDMELWGQLAAIRPDGLSRQQALDELERIREIRDLSENELRVMADLYQRQERWLDCKDVMMGLLVKNEKDMVLLDPWLQWLLDHDEDQQAAAWLKKCTPGTVTELRTKAHLQARRGKTQLALNQLISLIPDKLSEDEFDKLRVVADIVEQLGVYDARVYVVADRIWRRYVKVRPDEELLLAAFLGRRGGSSKVGEALALCGNAVKRGKFEEALQLAVAILRKNRAAAGNDEYANQMRAWFEEAKQADPENLAYLMQQAEFEDVVGNYDESEKWLRKYMENASVPDLKKAVVANNLAYLLALKGESEEPTDLIDFAMKILGPTADLRDTLGMVHLANNKPVMALKEFEAAIADGGATAFKYVHVAMAQLVNGKKIQAAAAIKEAVKKGLETFQLTKLEYESYREMVDRLKGEGLLKDSDLIPPKKK